MFRNGAATGAQSRRRSRLSSSTTKPLSTIQLVRLIIVIPPGEEVIPDVQQFAVQMDVDLELLEPTLDSVECTEMNAVMELLLKPASYLLCFLGDKYGECALPFDMREAEFDAIRTAAFEASNDVRLLDKYYELDKSRNPSEYRLRRIAIDPLERRALIDVIQTGAKQLIN
ncbi:hypothetical protein Tcan_18340 [Toxocara canis]|uniref:DUF4062 domain-containing protein n=1 Tax=Toxocara canis TaxID=6265 RepID=A0A0B2V367_TOXCA|nr:hypothetical protein Tcan_18340 [Toxocara canis]